MKKLTVKFSLLFALMAILFTACEKDTLVNSSLHEFDQIQTSQTSVADMVQSKSGIADSKGSTSATRNANCTPISESCSGASVEVCNNQIKVTITNSSLFQITINDVDQGYVVVETVCADWSPGNTCSTGTYTYTVPSSGNYSVQFSYDNGSNCGSGSFYVNASTVLCNPVNETCSGADVEVCGSDIVIDITNSSLFQVTINDVNQNYAVVNLTCADWYPGNNCGPGTYTYTAPSASNYSVQFTYDNGSSCGSGSFYVP